MSFLVALKISAAWKFITIVTYEIECYEIGNFSKARNIVDLPWFTIKMAL